MSAVRRRLSILTVGLTTLVASASVAQQGTIVVVNKGVATATLIDMPSGETVATLPTGDGPHEVVVSPDQRYAVVTDYGGQGEGGNTLTVIDVGAGRVARTIDLGQYRRPHGIVFQTNDVVVVTSEASQHVVLVDIEDGSIVRAVPTEQGGSHMVTPVVPGNLAYTSNIPAGTVSALDLEAGTMLRIMDIAPQVEAITASPDGREVWVGSNAQGTVHVLDPTSGQVDVAASGFGWPYRILITPDNRLVLIPDLRNNVLRFFDRESHEELGRVELPEGGPQGITLSPDGRTVFQSLSREARIAVIDLAAMTITGYIPAGETPDGIGFSTVTVNR